MHELGWRFDDWTRLARGAIAGHLLECAGQVTGGYFADPGYKDVDGLARLGFPIGEVIGRRIDRDHEAPGHRRVRDGAHVHRAAAVRDARPAAYATPDVVADITGATVAELGADRVRVVGVEGRERPATLKVSVGYRDGYDRRGTDLVRRTGRGGARRGSRSTSSAERLRSTGVAHSELRLDLVGLTRCTASVALRRGEPYEVRARVAARCDAACDARRIGDEVEALYTNGPAGGGGATKSMREIVAVTSAFVPREAVRTSIEWMEVSG